MIVYHFEQRTPAWFNARLGVATASDFDKIVTTTGKESAQLKSFACEKLAELFEGQSFKTPFVSEAMLRGQEMEAEARNMYSFLSDNLVKEVGFITTDDDVFGCSPDGLIGDEGLLEIKCPLPPTHIKYMIEGIDNAYRQQIMAQMIVSGRKWCDFFSYCPNYEPVLMRFKLSDDDKIAYEKAMNSYHDFFLASKNTLLNKGSVIKKMEIKGGEHVK